MSDNDRRSRSQGRYHDDFDPALDELWPPRQRISPGKRTLTQGLKPVQRRAAPAPVADERDVHRVAAAGLSGGGAPLPHLETIQRSFGHHDVSGVRAHVGGQAADAAGAIGARAYASGDDVAFAQAPDLHLAAHEAAHIVQQRGGVRLSGGVGRSGDQYERHADAVAERVVRGESAQPLLDQMAHRGSAGGPAVQRDDPEAASRQDLQAAVARCRTLSQLEGARCNIQQAGESSSEGVVRVGIASASYVVRASDLTWLLERVESCIREIRSAGERADTAEPSSTDSTSVEAGPTSDSARAPSPDPAAGASATTGSESDDARPTGAEAAPQGSAGEDAERLDIERMTWEQAVRLNSRTPRISREDERRLAARMQQLLLAETNQLMTMIRNGIEANAEMSSGAAWAIRRAQYWRAQRNLEQLEAQIRSSGHPHVLPGLRPRIEGIRRQVFPNRVSTPEQDEAWLQRRGQELEEQMVQRIRREVRGPLIRVQAAAGARAAGGVTIPGNYGYAVPGQATGAPSDHAASLVEAVTRLRAIQRDVARDVPHRYNGERVIQAVADIAREARGIADHRIVNFTPQVRENARTLAVECNRFIAAMPAGY